MEIFEKYLNEMTSIRKKIEGDVNKILEDLIDGKITKAQATSLIIRMTNH